MSDTKPTNPKDLAAIARLPLSLWPQTATIYGALGMCEGDLKYGGYNYREQGVSVSVYVDALLRHTFKFYNGEWADKKTKVPHLGSMLGCTGIIVDGFERGNITDDRPPTVDVSALIDSTADIVRHLQTIFTNSPGRFTQLGKAKS